jgi:putative two-component system response regulator
VDVYDALSNNRVHRDALPKEKVLSIMEEGKGCHFNPHIFESFLEVLPALREILMEHGDKKG